MGGAAGGGTGGWPRRPELAERLCRTARRIGARGWCQGTSGNFSAVLERRPLHLLISCSGASKYDLRPEELVVVDGAGRAVEGEAASPSAETLLHCRIAELAGAGAVLHSHSVPGTLVGEHYLAAGGVTIGGYEMLKGLAGITTHEAELFLPILANSQDIPRLCRGFEELHRARPALHGLLLAGHGLYTWGRDVQQAERHLEILEFLLELAAARTRFRPLPGGELD